MNVELEPQKNHDVLVFTSAGDANNIAPWVKSKNFDLWVCYYGDSVFSLANDVDFIFERKGGKMQNFHYAMQQWKDVLSQYKAILLADDDIIITGSDINKLFLMSAKYHLKALQPAFDPRGKISHETTQVTPLSKLRYTNFIEITFVLFEQKALFQFMELYEPKVNCWGVDWWFSYFINQNYGNKSVAIIDEIPSINPHDETKVEGSEIEKLTSLKQLAENWEEFRKHNNIITEQGTYTIYGKVKTYNPFLLTKFMINKLKLILIKLNKI